MNYINLLKRSLKLTWQYKFLWLFGFLIALTSGGGINITMPDFGTTPKTSYIDNPNFNLHSLLSSNLVWMILAILAVLFLIFLALWILSIISQGALIGCADKLDKKEKTSVKEGFKIGKTYFWRIFGLSLLIGLIIFLSFILLGLPVGLLFYFKLWGRAILLLLLALIIFIPEAIFLNLIFIYSQRIIVLNNLSIVNALKTSLNLIKNNFWPTIIIALILLGINLAVSTTIIFFVFLIALPIFAIFIISKIFLGSIIFWIFIILGAIIFLLFALTIRAILTAFSYNVWTLTFKELKKS